MGSRHVQGIISHELYRRCIFCGRGYKNYLLTREMFLNYSQDGWYSEGYDYQGTRVDESRIYSDTEYYPSTTTSTSSRRRGIFFKWLHQKKWILAVAWKSNKMLYYFLQDHTEDRLWRDKRLCTTSTCTTVPTDTGATPESGGWARITGSVTRTSDTVIITTV